jgi:glycosyltransferase involved in cell wall biosynthesis
MTPFISVFSMVNNEEEVLQYCLESYESFVDLIQVVSLVDNNSTDDTLDIIDSFKTRLPIVLQHHSVDSEHGKMRNLALEKCKAPWIFYLDSDETVDKTFHYWLLNFDFEKFDLIHFYKYSTIFDRNYQITEGNGHTQRMFRNFAGVHFPQNIHTEPTLGVDNTTWDRVIRLDQGGPLLFDHTSCKSVEALWAKGFRYKWANRLKVPGVGLESEYIWRVQESLRKKNYAEFPPYVQSRIFTGPEVRHSSLAEYEAEYKYQFEILNPTIGR